MSSINTDYTRRTLEDYLAASTRNTSGELGKSEFLSLLVAQLANQDPLEPQKDTEFIAQLAQFSTLEQMQALSQSYANSQASQMIGNYIEGTYEVAYQGYNDNGEFETRYETRSTVGIVTGLTYDKNGKATLRVQEADGTERQVELSDVSYMVNAESIEGYNFNNNVLSSSNLIGKYVYAKFTGYNVNEDGTVDTSELVDKTAEGFVDKIEIEGGIIYAVIGDVRFDVRHITNISNEAPPPEEEVTDPDA